MGLKEEVEDMKKEVKDILKDLEKDSNSVYLITREKNRYFVILIIVFVIFVSFLIFNSFYLNDKINNINSKLDLMINAEDDYLPYEENIEVSTEDGGNANYVDGNNNSINN